MKITCDSCGSKYTIADDKVQGRKVKVRCKNCGTNIVVDATSGGESTPEEAPADAGNLWTVNLSDEESRDMTTEEIVAGWEAGTVTEDAYVWRDGMADWKPVLDVAELKMKLVVHPAASSPLPNQTHQEPAKVAAQPAFAAPVAAAAPRVAAPTGQQEDIFSKSWGNPSAGGGGSDDDGKRPTGARNENSVLFSLDALKASAPEPAPKKPTKPTTADDLFSMGTMPGGGLLTTNVDLLTAPALAPPPAPVVAPLSGGGATAGKKGGSMTLILAAAIAVAGLGGGYFFMNRGDSAEAEAKMREAQESAEQKLREAEEARKKLEADLAKVRAEAEARGEDPAQAEKKAKEALANAEGKDPAKTDPAKDSASGAPKDPPKDSPTAAAPSAGASTPPKDTKPAATPPKESGGGGGGKSFDVSAAKAALGAAAANAASCAQPGGPKGSGKVQVTFAPSGRVTTATIIEGPFGGTSVGGCISSTFKRARVPAFDGSPTQVAKGFKI
jgi:predicted Zn finger-like uncharacterized protein